MEKTTGRHAVAAALAILFASACGGGSDAPPTDAQNEGPVANAGPDQTVEDKVVVMLDATASTDPDGDALTYSWTQTSGPHVVLGEYLEGWAKATLTAPTVPGGTTLTFELTVSDGEKSAKDTVSVTVNDVTAPTASVAPHNVGATSLLLGRNEPVIVTFSEPVDRDGTLFEGPLGDEAEPDWNADNTVATLTPKTDDGEWTSGQYRVLQLRMTDTAGNISNHGVSFLVKLAFENFQPADVVIGQPDMTKNNKGGGDAGLDIPYGRAWVHAGRLYLPDYSNNRVLGFTDIPEADGASADFVIGQEDFTGDELGIGQQALGGPHGVSVHDNRLVVTEYDNHRISIYTPAPNETENTAPGTIAAVVGQRDFDSREMRCAENRLNFPEDSIVTPDGKLIVTDSNNDRVLVWNTLPAGNDVPPDLVLGQGGFDQCLANDSNHNGVPDTTDGPAANTMFSPSGVWSDGTRLVVLDSNNHRALIWKTFPGVNGQGADIVLGQPDFESNAPNNSDDSVNVPGSIAANTFRYPYDGVVSNGEQLFIADAMNNRVLIWNSWPTENQQPADIVLGQANFKLGTANNDDADDETPETAPTARTMRNPRGLFLYQDQLIVTDGDNSRYLIYNSR